MRITIRGVRHDISIGPLATLSLAKAREKAHDVADGRDPASERRALRSPPKAPSEVIATKKEPTFEACWQAYWIVKEPQLSNGKHRDQWVSTMTTYVLPHIGHRPIGDIKPDEILDLLKPIWHRKERQPDACCSGSTRSSSRRSRASFATRPAPAREARILRTQDADLIFWRCRIWATLPLRAASPWTCRNIPEHHGQRLRPDSVPKVRSTRREPQEGLLNERIGKPSNKPRSACRRCPELPRWGRASRTAAPGAGWAVTSSPTPVITPSTMTRTMRRPACEALAIT
jgi:hypothetical protein